MLRRKLAPCAARADVLASYGDLGQVPDTMIAGFADMLASEAAPDPQLVVDAYLALAEAAPGERPTRTVVGITWGVDESPPSPSSGRTRS